MGFPQRLALETADDRAYLLAAPAIQRCMAGDVTRSLYVAFLTQAYHHVKHTVPLLMAPLRTSFCAARVCAGLRPAAAALLKGRAPGCCLQFLKAGNGPGGKRLPAGNR